MYFLLYIFPLISTLNVCSSFDLRNLKQSTLSSNGLGILLHLSSRLFSYSNCRNFPQSTGTNVSS